MSAPAVTPDASSGGGHAVVVHAKSPGLVLAVVLLATFVINLDTTIVNVALPALSKQLHATTSGLQWVIDAYNLAFAGLILTGGTIGDRFGRRRTLAVGLAVFAIGSGVSAAASSTGALIVWRVVMGAAAAFVFPTTLSIISQTFPDRAARAKAVGAWGAATGVAVAVGPIVGGALLAHFWWGSIFLAMVPVAAVTMIGAFLVIPKGRAVSTEPLDLRGLTVSALALTTLVYTIIEAPDRGWGSGRTLAGFAIAAAGFAALIVIERRQAHPMLDVRLFANMRFTAASGAVTLAFFALSGFIFLIVLYFQIMRGYSPLQTGVRVLPVAVSLAVSSGIGTVLAVRVGNKIVVAWGLLLVGAGYAWVAGVQTQGTSYGLIVLQMVVLGTGMGLSTAPATEAILGVVRPDQAGIGSAVNDATRLVGGTLGVAVLGSVYASLYRSKLDHAGVSQSAIDIAKGSFGASRAAANQLSPSAGRALLDHANSGFLDGLHASCGVAAAVCALGVVIVLAFLPAFPREPDDPPTNNTDVRSARAADAGLDSPAPNGPDRRRACLPARSAGSADFR